MSTAPPAVRVTGLSHSYERWGHRVAALRGVELSVPDGQWLQLVGPNGSGKSTLLRLLAGQLEPQAGDIAVHGSSTGALSRRHLARHLFWVPQDPAKGTAAGLTVAEHLALADGLGHQSDKELCGLMESFALDVAPRQPVTGLSGGQRRLLSLLIAMLRPGSTILLDEPLAALDPKRSALCIEALERLREAGKTLVCVSHDAEFAFLHGDRTVGLSEGRVVYDKAGQERAIDDRRVIWEAQSSRWSPFPDRDLERRTRFSTSEASKRDP